MTKRNHSKNKLNPKIIFGIIGGLLIVCVTAFTIININISREIVDDSSASNDTHISVQKEPSPVHLNFSGTGLQGKPTESIETVSGREIDVIELPIWCNFEYPYYIDSSSKVKIKGRYSTQTQYDGMVTNAFSDYGVTTCRTEAYVKYKAEDGIKIADSTQKDGEKRIELKPDESRFIVWRFWNHFADKTSVVKETENTVDKTDKIVEFVNEQGEVVKTFRLRLMPIIADDDFFNNWKKAIERGGKNTEDIESKQSYNLGLEYYKGSDEIWYGDGIE